MLTRKILSMTAAVALTASVSMLAGCPNPGTTNPSPTDSSSASVAPTASATASATGSVTPTASASATVAPTTNPSASLSNQPSATATPSASNSTVPVGQTGGTSDIKERATFNGKVYDPNGIPVVGAKVSAKSVDSQVTWVGEDQLTENGSYVFRNAPVGSRIEVTATKDGWTTRLRTEVLKSNLQGDPTANVFDFGGLNAGSDVTSSFYSIQDEPEVVSIKINGVSATSSGGFPTGSSDKNNGTAIANLPPGHDANSAGDELKDGIDATNHSLATSLSGLDNSRLDIELVFSEPVKQDSVTNNFKVISQKFDVRRDILGNPTNFTIDENLSSLTFTWAADNKSVLVKTNKPVLSTTSSPEARYLINWSNPFKDNNDKNALKIGQGNVSPTGYFKYSPGTNNDFNVFSVKVDDQDPRLVSIQALDGGGSNDILKLNFSEPLELVNHQSYALGLSDPADTTNNANLQLFGYNTTNTADSNNNGGTPAINNATVLGYVDYASVFGATPTSDNDTYVQDPAFTGTFGTFHPVYEIGRLPQNITAQNQVVLRALAQDAAGANQQINGNAISTVPHRGATDANQIGQNSLLRYAKIDGNVVTLEFAPEAFQRNEKIIVSVGNAISSHYQDTSNGIPRTNVFANDRNANGNTPSFDRQNIVDPAGNNISTSNSTTSGNLDVNDSLRVATAS